MPPYITVGFIRQLAATIDKNNGQITQTELEAWLSLVYRPERLASMVLNRYPKTPIIDQFHQTISEAVYAHFSGLHHIAVGGLIPVIEGAGRLLAKNKGFSGDTKNVFSKLVKNTKDDVIKRKIGATGEIVDMLDSFQDFIEDYFFIGSTSYKLDDGTNRHGISHGSYTDVDYGRPLNFYKTIAGIDFLTFISSLNTNHISGFVPDDTPESTQLATIYTRAIISADFFRVIPPLTKTQNP